MRHLIVPMTIDEDQELLSVAVNPWDIEALIRCAKCRAYARTGDQHQV